MNDILEQNINKIKVSAKIIHTQDTNKTMIRTCIRLSFLLFSVNFNKQNKLVNNN